MSLRLPAALPTAPGGLCGAFYATGASLSLTRNVIAGNYVDGQLNSKARGGALYLSSSDATLANGDFVFASFTTGGANTNPSGITSGTADDDVITLTLAAEIGPDETGTVAFTAASVITDGTNDNTQTATVNVTDGIGAVPAISSAVTKDNDSDGQIDQLVVTFDKNVDIVDGSAADGFPQIAVAGYTIANADYAVVKALVEGKVDTFMGFKFLRCERLTQDGSGNRQVIAWAEDGLLLTQGNNMNKTRITERDDKSYSVQVFRSEMFGATRMEEDKVVEIACVES